MIERILIFLLSMTSYGIFVASFLYAVCFLGNIVVPRSIDIGNTTPTVDAVMIDLLILGLFAVQHSVMARPAFKRSWTQIVPPAAERSIYVLISSLLLLLLCWKWQPLPVIVWQASGMAASLLIACYWIGWGVVLASTFMIDHLDLFGLRQGYAALCGVAARSPAFTMRWLYRFVRHPLMLGFLVVFWSAPLMTVGHLLFALMTTGYIFVGVTLEERDLVDNLGETYQRYRRQVSMLVPFFPRRHISASPSEVADPVTTGVPR